MCIGGVGLTQACSGIAKLSKLLKEVLNNVVLRSLLYQKLGYVQSLLSKFNIQSLSCPKHELKLHIWNTFVSETMCRGH